MDEGLQNQGVGGASASGPGSREPSPAVSAASGFDPSRLVRPGMAERLGEFESAVFGLPWVADRVVGGQQFNVYDCASNDEADDPDNWEYALCVGPITDHRFICRITGADRARLVEAAMKVATEAMRERLGRDSDGSGEAGETAKTGSTVGDSAGRKASPQPPASPGGYNDKS